MKRAKRRSILVILASTPAAFTQGFSHALHHGTARQDNTQHEKGQRFLLMPMDSCQQLFELLLAVHPEDTSTTVPHNEIKPRTRTKSRTEARLARDAPSCPLYPSVDSGRPPWPSAQAPL